mgnify:FL=1
MKKVLLILSLTVLSSCADPHTGRDVFGNLSWDTASAPVQIGENKYYVEMQQRPVGIKRASSFCGSMGKSLEVEKIDTPENAYMMLTFGCK